MHTSAMSVRLKPAYKWPARLFSIVGLCFALPVTLFISVTSVYRGDPDWEAIGAAFTLAWGLPLFAYPAFFGEIPAWVIAYLPNGIVDAISLSERNR